MRICFDMDGTIANLYGVENWLADLQAHNARPYTEAKVMLNMNSLARILNRLQRNGYEIGIISWLAKNSTEEYNAKVAKAKRSWLNKHLASVKFDFIEIVPYGTDKNIVNTCSADILFDDEEPNRKNWNGKAFDADNIIETLKAVYN